MNIAYFSPLNPVKSGISDFSEELLMELKEYVNIDVFVDGYKPTNKDIINNFNIYDIKDIYKKEIREKYDHLVYHVGNNAAAHSNIVKALIQFPGICELHDISLHHFIAEDTIAKNNTQEYLRIMRYCHGEKGENRAINFLKGNASPPWEEESLTYTVNKHIIDKSKAMIVHSDMAKQMVKGINPAIPIINIPHHTFDIVNNNSLYQKECREKLGLAQDMLIFASFGFASENKRIKQILEALSIFKKRNKDKFRYYIVGKVQGINVESIVKEMKLTENVIVTGYTKLDDFKYYMGACDIAFNLRYPTQGESSGSLHRLLGMGKPIIVTDIGSFQEYPDDVVIKVPYKEFEIQSIYEAILKLTKDKVFRENIVNKALAFAEKNCNLKTNALKYAEFFKQIQLNEFSDEEIDSLIDKLFELGLIDDEYIDYLIKDKSLSFIV